MGIYIGSVDDLIKCMESLKSQVAQLTKERDAALREVEHLKQEIDKNNESDLLQADEYLEVIREQREEVLRLRQRMDEAENIIVDALNNSYHSLDETWAREWMKAQGGQGE